MAWRVELDPAARREIDGLDPQVAKRILAFLSNRVAQRDDPRSVGEPLKGSRLGGYWKYRVGDYRIIACIEDTDFLVLVVRLGHRRDVYRK